MKTLLKIVIPILVLVAGGVGAWTMIQSRPVVETRPPEVVSPLVRTMTVKKESVGLTVRSQGTVVPRRETVLVTEVSGRVVYVSPSLAVGAFVEEDDLLLRIDPTDYELAEVRAKADLVQATVRLEREEAEAKLARREWEELGEGPASPLTIREPQLAEARAAVASAEASLKQARLELERTDVRAPFAGRVRSKNVEIGQFVSRGYSAAQLYAVDSAEVILPLPDQDLAYLNLPLGFRVGSGAEEGPSVVLSSRFAGRDNRWTGRIVRTGAEIDPRSRMVQVVVEVSQPYAANGRTPLAVGMFVEAEIRGRTFGDVVVLPRSAIRSDDQVLVVDAENRLRFRSVDLLRSERDRVIVSTGLEEGERVCLSPLETAVDGMKVRVEDDGAASSRSGSAVSETMEGEGSR